MSSQSSNDIPLGRLGPQTTWSEYNSLAFVINSFLSKIQTATLVKIVSCTNSGGVSPVGFVDVIPLVDQIDGLGVPVPHVTLFNIPYFRAQGGSNAIILDPQAGDIGICVFASRDISKVKSSKKSSPPDSLRQFSYSDGLYIGGVLNGPPSQYVQFSTAGIKIHTPTRFFSDRWLKCFAIEFCIKHLLFIGLFINLVFNPVQFVKHFCHYLRQFFSSNAFASNRQLILRHARF